MSNDTIDKTNWYCIKFDVPKDKNITAIQFSRKMNAFLEQIEAFNHSIVGGIDETYTVASYIEDFETGSIKWWLLDRLQKIDDKAIDKFVDKPIKTTVAAILKFAKQKAIEVLQEQDITQEERQNRIVTPIIEEIHKQQIALERHELSPKIKLNEDSLLESISNMSNISKELGGEISFIEDYNNQDKEISIAQNFTYHKESVANITEEEKQLPPQTILGHIQVYSACFEKVDKWKFKYNDKIETIDINESDITTYMNGKFINGDTFYVQMEIVERKTAKGYINDYKIIKIINFIRGKEQLDLI
jgi:hypothetical protein